MKTTMKQLAAGTFIALILLVVNVKAEGREIKASIHESIETTLQLEKWMTDENIWNTGYISHAECIQETESSLELESWMTNERTWHLHHNFVEETEAEMELESWMTSEETWNLKDINAESELTIENWMIDSNIWK